MDFGIFILMQQRNQGKNSNQIMQEAIEQTCLADKLGFGAAWYAEHHFSNYGLCSSPLMMIAHCAAITKNIRLGSGVVIAPLYTPARLIADIAMADQFSHGRLNIGIGGGYQNFEFERFSVDLQSGKERTLEMLDMLEAGLKNKKFEYNGTHYRQPSTAISQRVVQTPMPPVWVASGDPLLMGRAIRSDYHVFISGGEYGTERLVKTRARIDQLALAEGKDPEKVKVGLLRFAFASNNSKEVEHYVDCARYQRRISYSLKTRSASILDDYMIEEAAFEGEPTFDEMLNHLPVGDIDTVVERLVTDIRATRPCHVALQTQIGDFDHKTMLKQLELWSKTVIPAVMHEISDDDWFQEQKDEQDRQAALIAS